jgi:hypothetical protein
MASTSNVYHSPRRTALLAFEKESFDSRGMQFDVAATAPNGIQVEAVVLLTIPVIESGPDADVPDALFEFTPPEGATVIEYPEDSDGESVMAQYRKAIGQN